MIRENPDFGRQFNAKERKIFEFEDIEDLFEGLCRDLPTDEESLAAIEYEVRMFIKACKEEQEPHEKEEIKRSAREVYSNISAVPSDILTSTQSRFQENILDQLETLIFD
jgi:hypothetical protein